MALSHGIALGVFSGLFKRTAVFEITEKAGGTGTSAADQKSSATQAATSLEQRADAVSPATKPVAKNAGKAEPSAAIRALSQVREEAGLLIALIACIVGMYLTRRPEHIESAAWMWILALQAVPYLAAVICAFLSVRPEQSDTATQVVPVAFKRKPRLVKPGMVGMPSGSAAMSDGSD